MENSFNIMKINIGKKDVNICSYFKMLTMEKSSYVNNKSKIDLNDYLSMLFLNMGYDKRPKNSYQISNNVPIEYNILTDPITFPKHTNIKWIFDNIYVTSLYNFMEVTKNWIYDEYERGHLIDNSKLFQTPSKYEMDFNIINNINNNKPSPTIKTKLEYWRKSDIFIRRWYNISPKIDKEYWEKSIFDFEKYSKKIRLFLPWIAFITCLINPDIFFNALRTAEKEAYDISYNQAISDPNNINANLIPDYILANNMNDTLLKQMAYIYLAFKNKGISVFNMEKNNNSEIKYQLPIDNKNYSTITMYEDNQLNMGIINSVKTKIYETELDGDHKSYILQYVDGNSLYYLNKLGEDNIVRKNTYKKLYYTIMQIKLLNPEILNRKEKLLFSMPFFINQEIFALYHKPKNKFYLSYPDLILRELSPQEIIEFYKINLNKDVKLDPKEVIDSFDSESVEFIDLKQLYLDSIPANKQNQLSMNNINTTNSSIQENNNENSIEFNMNDVVM